MPSKTHVFKTDHPSGYEGRTANPALSSIQTIPHSTLLIPHNFDPDKFVAKYKPLRNYRDNICWLLSKTIRLHHYTNKPHDTYVNIHSNTIKDYTHPSVYRVILNYLLKDGVIESDGEWHRGTKSLGWRIGKAFRGPSRVWVTTKPALVARIKRDRIRVAGETVPVEQLNATHAGLHHWLTKIEMDLPLAQEQAIRRADASPDGADKLPIYLDAINAVTHDPSFIVDPRQGRIYTPISNLFKEARSALTIDGQHLVSLDIKNSQMIFFACLMLRHELDLIRQEEDWREGGGVVWPPLSGTTGRGGRKGQRGGEAVPPLSGTTGRETRKAVTHRVEDVFTEDQLKFWNLVMDGQLYDFLMAEYNDNAPKEKQYQNRDGFKPALFQAVFYGDNTLPYANADCDLSVVFYACFPTVWDFVLSQKSGPEYGAWTKLSIDMQRAESDFVINKVCHRLIRYHPEVPVLTVHDSIMTTPNCLDTVHRVMMEEFKRMAGITPRIQITFYGAQDDDAGAATPAGYGPAAEVGGDHSRAACPTVEGGSEQAGKGEPVAVVGGGPRKKRRGDRPRDGKPDDGSRLG